MGPEHATPAYIKALSQYASDYIGQLSLIVTNDNVIVTNDNVIVTHDNVIVTNDNVIVTNDNVIVTNDNVIVTSDNVILTIFLISKKNQLVQRLARKRNVTPGQPIFHEYAIHLSYPTVRFGKSVASCKTQNQLATLETRYTWCMVTGIITISQSDLGSRMLYIMATYF